MWTVAQIRSAIEDEREIASQPLYAQVSAVHRVHGGVHIKFVPTRDIYGRAFDETLAGARAWWPNDPPAMAEVLLVDPDEPSLLLSRLTGALPQIGQTLSIYEPDYLKPLAELWNAPALASAALEALMAEPSVVEEPCCTLEFAHLRKSQRRALGLARHRTSLLWGPPGTGKTTTLGAIVAEELASGRAERIIVTATTHTAVDQLVLAADNALERSKRTFERSRIKRFGTRADPQFFIGREHLLPTGDLEAFGQLASLIDLEPPKADVETWAAWRGEVDALRARLKLGVRDVLAGNSCIGMTVASALYWFDALSEVEIDLVIVDEASQLSAPAAQMIATSGRNSLFAGDPQQLPAVVRTKTPKARQVLSTTVFDLANSAPEVFLEEQSRMAPPICEIVSKAFYQGRLVVAKEQLSDVQWRKEHSAYWINGNKQPQFLIQETNAAPTWSQTYRGPIRYGSAREIMDLIDDMLGAYIDVSEIMVLTPFRAQRAMLRMMFAAFRFKGIHVSTVHRSQGSERKVVIFDPVEGASDFLSGREGERLINVALSRAQTQVVVVMSQSDRENPTLKRIAALAGYKQPTQKGVPTLREFVTRSDFPTCLVGQTIRVGSIVGEVVTLERGGDVFVIACHETGRQRKFNTAIALGEQLSN